MAAEAEVEEVIMRQPRVLLVAKLVVADELRGEEATAYTARGGGVSREQVNRRTES